MLYKELRVFVNILIPCKVLKQFSQETVDMAGQICIKWLSSETAQEARMNLFLFLHCKPRHWPFYVPVMDTRGALSCSASYVHLSGSRCSRKDFDMCTGGRNPGICVGNGDPSKVVPSSWERSQIAEATTLWNSIWNVFIHSINTEKWQSSGAVLGASNPTVNHPEAKTTKRTCDKIKSIRR